MFESRFARFASKSFAFGSAGVLFGGAVHRHDWCDALAITIPWISNERLQKAKTGRTAIVQKAQKDRVRQPGEQKRTGGSREGRQVEKTPKKVDE